MSGFVIFDDETLRQSAAAGYQPAAMAMVEIERQRAQGIDAVAGCSDAGMISVCSRAFALMRAASVGRSAKRQDRETGLGPKGEHAVGGAETPKGWESQQLTTPTTSPSSPSIELDQ